VSSSDASFYIGEHKLLPYSKENKHILVRVAGKVVDPGAGGWHRKDVRHDNKKVAGTRRSVMCLIL